VRAAFALPTDLLEQRFMAIPQARALRMVQVLQAKGARLDMVEWIRWATRLPAHEVKGGIRYRRLLRPVPEGGAWTRLLFLRGLTRQVREALVATRADGLVVQDGELLLAAARASRQLGAPLFYDSQEHWPGMVAAERPLEARLYALLERRLARRLAHVYTVSEPIAARFRDMGCAATVVYNSRDAADIRPHEVPRAEAKRRLALPEDSFVLGFVGSITAESGLAPCLEALRMLPRDVRLVVVGGPREQLQWLKAEASRLGVADRLAVHPPVAQDEAVRLACAFDVGLLALTGSGPNYAHRAPYKLFEYMALGLPIIVSDYPEMRRIAVQEAGFGLPVRPGVAGEVRDAALRLRDEESLRRELGQRARGAFDRIFSGERQKERLRASHAFWR
jgi:glycosyltransferase involved in cell wall biosynthesis